MTHRLLLAAVLLAGCSPAPSTATSSPAASASAAPPEARWLVDGTTDERFARAAKHLRGLDVAMAEVGYRYGELHWAGKDRNWGYAAYQLGKIETAMANGVERRPKRAASARMMEAPVAALRKTIDGHDGAGFDAAFPALTATCNTCHQAEQVPFIRIEPPGMRTTVVHPPVSGAP